MTPTRSFPSSRRGPGGALRRPPHGNRRRGGCRSSLSDPSGGSGQSLDADLRNRLAACEEALDAVQTRLATIEAQVHGVDDDELEDVSDANWASATRAVTDLDRQVAALRRRLPPLDAPRRAAAATRRSAGWACCNLFRRRAPRSRRVCRGRRRSTASRRSTSAMAPTPASDLSMLTRRRTRRRCAAAGALGPVRAQPVGAAGPVLAQGPVAGEEPLFADAPEGVAALDARDVAGAADAAPDAAPDAPEGTQMKPRVVVGRWLPAVRPRSAALD